jgi:N-acetyl-anhydromuramyl-L-alanine amidase AmpD
VAWLPNVEHRPIPRIVHGWRSDVRYIVLHTTEGENLAATEAWFKSYLSRGVGSHLGVGRFGRRVQWADTNALVYHAAGANTHGIGIEQSGKASYSRARWLLRRRQLRATAKDIARCCKIHRLGEPSTTNVRRHSSFPQGGHVDPGKGYPLDKVLALARYYYHLI